MGGAERSLVSYKGVKPNRWQESGVPGENCTQFPAILKIDQDEGGVKIACSLNVGLGQVVSHELEIPACPPKLRKLLARFKDDSSVEYRVEEGVDWTLEVEGNRVVLTRTMWDDQVYCHQLTTPQRAAYFAKALKRVSCGLLKVGPRA